MKQFFAFCIIMLTASGVFAQMPKAINYQAVARNAQGQAIANQNIRVRLSIINTAGSNAVLYSETRNVTTNALGLFNIQIGSAGATVTSGNFNAINWVENLTTKESLKVEIDLTGNGSFTDMGTQSLATVPYAFAAETAKSAMTLQGNMVAETAPNPGDVLVWDGGKWEAVAGSTLHPSILPLTQAVGWSTTPATAAWQWVGYQTFNLTEDRRITATISAILGTTTGTATLVGYSIGYQSVDASGIPTGPISLLSQSGVIYPEVAQINSKNVYTASASHALPAGRYRFGFIVRNTSAVALNNTGSVSGFIIFSH